MNTHLCSTEVFHSLGKRFAVTFDSVVIHEYVQRKQYRANKRNRKAIICVLREAMTGAPFTGAAILSPTEKKSSIDKQMAMRLALKRAIASYTGCQGCREDMWRDYREEMLKKYEPTKWNDILAARKAAQELRASKIKTIRAKTKLKERLMREKIIDFSNGKNAKLIRELAITAMSGE